MTDICTAQLPAEKKGGRTKDDVRRLQYSYLTKYPSVKPFSWYVIEDDDKGYCTICKKVGAKSIFVTGLNYEKIRKQSCWEHLRSKTHQANIPRANPVKAAYQLFSEESRRATDQKNIRLRNYMFTALYCIRQNNSLSQIPEMVIDLLSDVGVTVASGGHSSYSYTEYLNSLSTCVLEEDLEEIRQTEYFTIIIGKYNKQLT